MSAPQPPPRSGPGARGANQPRGAPRSRGPMRSRGQPRGMQRGGPVNRSTPSGVHRGSPPASNFVHKSPVRDSRASTLPSRAPAPFEFTNRGVDPRESRVCMFVLYNCI